MKSTEPAVASPRNDMSGCWLRRCRVDVVEESSKEKAGDSATAAGAKGATGATTSDGTTNRWLHEGQNVVVPASASARCRVVRHLGHEKASMLWVPVQWLEKIEDRRPARSERCRLGVG